MISLMAIFSLPDNPAMEKLLYWPIGSACLKPGMFRLFIISSAAGMSWPMKQSFWIFANSWRLITASKEFFRKTRLNLHALFLKLLKLPPGREKEKEKLVVVLDGLDEATDWKPGTTLFPSLLVQGVYCIFSARPVANREWI